MPRDLSADAQGRIGPNAILQMIPVLDDVMGAAARRQMLARLGVAVPSGDRMIPEAPAALLHREVRRCCGGRAAGIAARAGRGTAEYILAHRIPEPAQALLRALPAGLSARLLSRAIAANAWTFAGSGRFEARTPWHFVMHDNPVIHGETADRPICHWHAAVFETLYRRLVTPEVLCRETQCQANGARECHFFMTCGMA